MNTQTTPETLSILNTTPELPTLPAAVPSPEVSYGFNDVGMIKTEVTIDGATIGFWTEGRNKVVNSDLYSGKPNPWSAFLSAEDLQAAMAWGEVMHSRVRATARDFLIGLSTPDFKDDLVAVARG